MTRQLLKSAPEQMLCSPHGRQNHVEQNSTTALLESKIHPSDIAELSATRGEFEPEKIADSVATLSLTAPPIETLLSAAAAAEFVRECPW